MPVIGSAAEGAAGARLACAVGAASPRGRMPSVTRISDEELAQAMAENVDAEGNDVGLAAWVASWTPEQRAQSAEGLRRWAAEARHALDGNPGGPSND